MRNDGDEAMSEQEKNDIKKIPLPSIESLVRTINEQALLMQEH